MNFSRFRLLLCSLLLLVSGMVQAAGIDSFFNAELEAPNGQAVALSSFRGKPLVVNFIERACESCVADSRELARQRQANGKLSVVTILIDENPANAGDFIKTSGVPHPVLVAGSRKGLWLMQNLGHARGKAPFAIAVGKTGKLVFSTPEALTAATAASMAEAALK